jgi:putative FmdB family regulatory protein
MAGDVPIYVYRCDCGLRFERLTSRDAEAPRCPECGGETHKIPAGFSLGSRAGSASPKDGLAPPWRAMAGNPEKLRREVEFRQRLAASHAGDSPPASTGGAAAADSGRDSGPPPAAG